MSLAEKWEEYVGKNGLHRLHISELAERQKDFYAGAEAALEQMIIEPRVTLEAEIDRFKGQK